MASRQIRCLASCAAVLIILSPVAAESALISVDPGPVGTSTNSITMPFSDLDGTPLNGQTLSLDFVFDAMKHAEVEFANLASTLNEVYFASVEFDTDNPGQLPLPDFATGFLSDENGDAISYPGFLGRGISRPFVGGGITYRLGWNEAGFGFVISELNKVTHHDVHFNVPLPSVSGRSITSANLRLNISSPGSITIGAAVVPEPSTLVLCSVGTVALAGFGWRQRRKRSA